MFRFLLIYHHILSLMLRLGLLWLFFWLSDSKHKKILRSHVENRKILVQIINKLIEHSICFACILDHDQHIDSGVEPIASFALIFLLTNHHIIAVPVLFVIGCCCNAYEVLLSPTAILHWQVLLSVQLCELIVTHQWFFSVLHAPFLQGLLIEL